MNCEFNEMYLFFDGDMSQCSIQRDFIKMSSRTEALIDKKIDQKQYYDGHQMIKTLIARQKSKQCFSDAVDTCIRYSLRFAGDAQYELCADLGILMIQSKIDEANRLGVDPADAVSSVEFVELIIGINSEIPFEGTRERIKLLEEAIRASRSSKHPRGHPKFHELLGEAHLKEGRYGQAVLHLVLCDEQVQPLLIAAVDKAVDPKSLNAVYASERSLFVLRTVFILLSLEKNSISRTILDHFKAGEDSNTDACLQFAYLVHEAAAVKDLDFLDEVKTKYQLLFRRDGQLQTFLEVIEQKMGRQRSQPKGLSSLFNSLLGGGMKATND